MEGLFPLHAFPHRSHSLSFNQLLYSHLVDVRLYLHPTPYNCVGRFQLQRRRPQSKHKYQGSTRIMAAVH